MPDPKAKKPKSEELLEEFAKEFHPLESGPQLLDLVDARTGAHYCECHVEEAGSYLLEPQTSRSIPRNSPIIGRTAT